MARRVTLRSDGDEWTFEEGRPAFFYDRKGDRQRGNFSVTSIGAGRPLRIETDLTGLSRFGWEPVIEWWGPYDLTDD